MKWILSMMTVLAVGLSLLTFAGDDENTPNEEKPTQEQSTSQDELKTPGEKLSYALGMQVGEDLKKLNVDIDAAAFTRAVTDILSGKNTLLTHEQANEIKKPFLSKRQEEQAKKLKEIGDKNRKDGEAFLKENKKKKDVITTTSGLQYSVSKKGNGPKPKATDKVSVHYSGKLIDSTEFDSSYRRGQPLIFIVNERVIPGWTEGLQLMNVGSNYRFFIPPNLAYGEKGYGNGDVIGPNAVLIFDIELLSIEK